VVELGKLTEMELDIFVEVCAITFFLQEFSRVSKEKRGRERERQRQIFGRWQVMESFKVDV